MSYFLIFLGLWTITSGESSPDRPLYVVPTHLLTNWTAASPSDLRCPPISPYYPLDNCTSRSVKILRQLNHKELLPSPGHLCIGFTYTTECSEGFFGTQTVTKTITHFPVTVSGCQSAILEHNRGNPSISYFPARSCSWMSTEKKSLNFLLINQHPIYFDPYKGGFVDSLFPTELCKSEICETVHKDTLWLGSTPEGKECSPFEDSDGIIYANQDNKDLYMRHHEMHILSFQNSCRMEYCNVHGIRFQNGQFLGGVFSRNFIAQCPPGTTVSFLPLGNQVENLEVEVQDLRDKMECVNAVQTIRATKSSDFLTLSHLTPSLPGHFPIYRLNNWRLEKATAKWEPIVQFSNLSPINVGLLKNGSVFTWTHWVPSGIGQLQSGYNGIHKSPNGPIIIPNVDILKMEYSDSSLISHSLEEIQHPIVNKIKVEETLEVIDSLMENNQIDITGWMGRVWSGFWGKLGMILTVIVGICVLFLILKITILAVGFARKHHRQSGDPEAQEPRGRTINEAEHIELQPIPRASGNYFTAPPPTESLW